MEHRIKKRRKMIDLGKERNRGRDRQREEGNRRRLCFNYYGMNMPYTC